MPTQLCERDCAEQFSSLPVWAKTTAPPSLHCHRSPNTQPPFAPPSFRDVVETGWKGFSFFFIFFLTSGTRGMLSAFPQTRILTIVGAAAKGVQVDQNPPLTRGSTWRSVRRGAYEPQHGQGRALGLGLQKARPASRQTSTELPQKRETIHGGCSTRLGQNKRAEITKKEAGT